MVSILIADGRAKEADALASLCRRLTARFTEDALDCALCTDLKQAQKALEARAARDMNCLDLELPGGVSFAERVREAGPQGLILLIAPQELSPMEYLKPSIMPSGLLLRPFTAEQARKALADSFRVMGRLREADACFSVETREGTQRIPYREICYFEAREKRVNLVSDRGEFVFYDTLDRLESALPGGFLRCHRSFIVRRERVESVKLSQNLLYLEDGEPIPLSRSYKARVKEAIK